MFSVLILLSLAPLSIAQPPPPVPVPVPTPSGTPPAPLLTPQQQAQLRSLFKTAQNERKAVSCVIYVGRNVYELVLWGNQIAIRSGKGGLPLPPPSGVTPVYTGQCDFIDWNELAVTKLVAWPISDPLLGVPDPSYL
jgi:hypothetical protein